MRILVQIVKEATLKIDGLSYARIKHGLVLYVGFTSGDDEQTIMKAANKIKNLRIFPDADGKTNLSLLDVGGALLSISQFTLYGDAINSNRPSFTKSLAANLAQELYFKFNNTMREMGLDVHCGKFGAHMEIKQVNDGPFSLWLEF